MNQKKIPLEISNKKRLMIKKKHKLVSIVPHHICNSFKNYKMKSLVHIYRSTKRLLVMDYN